MDDFAALYDIEENVDVLQLLEEQVQSPLGVLPFVGAGMSAPFGFPLWTAFLIEQARRARIEPQIKQRLQSAEYEEAAEDLLQVRKHLRFQDALRSAYRKHPFDTASAVSRLPLLSPGPVITTNFDGVLEGVFEQADTPFEKIVLGRRVDDAVPALQLNKRVLIKLHGDYAYASDRVLTLTEYTAAYGYADPAKVDFSLPLPKFLRLAVQNRPLFFLGCSLNQDRTLRVLRTVVEENRDLAHYALVPLPENESEFVHRDQFLAEHGIRPIWYPTGHHGFIDLVLEHLVRIRLGHTATVRPILPAPQPPRARSDDWDQTDPIATRATPPPAPPQPTPPTLATTPARMSLPRAIGSVAFRDPLAPYVSCCKCRRLPALSLQREMEQSLREI